MASPWSTRASRKPPACHPDKKYYAKGLCRTCYKRAEYRADPERHRAYRSGYTRRNRDAIRARSKKWYEENKERAKALNRAIRIRAYGISVEQYDQMLLAQDKCCALCARILSDRICIDHDHATGIVRALLCVSCNSGLGDFQDDPELMRRAAEYVERHRMVEQWIRS